MVRHRQQQFGPAFTFEGWAFNSDSGCLSMQYHNPEWGVFTEQMWFPTASVKRLEQLGDAWLNAVDCLYWMAGVSYYKTTLAQHLVFKGRQPSELQARWLTDTWQAGLAELAVANGLPWLDHIQFQGGPCPSKAAASLQLAARSLVAIGGGKDSLVAIEALKQGGEAANLLQVGQSAFITEVAGHTGLPLLAIKRQVDSKLAEANAAGAYNGHIPITAINGCVGVVAALLADFDSVVFANERSADEGNLVTEDGRWVNHQYSKSLAYERQWQQVIAQHIAADLHCFSLLRPFSELAIIKRFAQLPQYFAVFSSCNRNFHLSGSQNQAHHWCGVCPKCAFVFLCLAPFISQQQLLHVFRKNLLDDAALQTLFDALLGIEGNKPFECVGEALECRLAVQRLGEHPDWQEHPQVRHWLSVLPPLSVSQEDALMQPSAVHMIPDKRRFLKVMDRVT